MANDGSSSVPMNRSALAKCHQDTSSAEIQRLVLEAAQTLQYTVKSVLFNGKEKRYPCPHLAKALTAIDHLLGTGSRQGSHPSDPMPANRLALLARISAELGLARATFREDRCNTTGEAAFVHGLLEYAFEFADRLCGAYGELPLSLDTLRCMGTFAGARRVGACPGAADRPEDGKPTITAVSPLLQGGQTASELLARCAFDIEAAANAVTVLGDRITESEQIHVASLIRCYGTRIKALNSVLMSYITGDEVITLADAQHALYRGAKHLPKGAL